MDGFRGKRSDPQTRFWYARLNMAARLFSSVLALCVVSGAATDVAYAETNAPENGEEFREIAVGTALVATADIELQRAALAKGARVHVTKIAMKKGRLTTVDVELPDGHVVKRVGIEAIQKSFVVAADE